MNPALKKIIAEVVDFLASRKLAFEPPDHDPDRRRVQRTAARVIKVVKDLESASSDYREAHEILLRRAADSDPGRALIKSVQDAGLNIEIVTAMFLKLKKSGANENADLESIATTIATLGRRPDPDGAAALPSAPGPESPKPPNPSSGSAERPPAKPEASATAALRAELRVKGKA
jgi:hypothetical protein